MLKNKKYVIFDWNGTLIDDAFVFVDVLNVLLKRRHLKTINLKEYRELFCFPIKDFYKKINIDISYKSFQQLKVEFVSEYNLRRYSADLFIDTKLILEKLRGMGFSLSILSASNQNTLNDLTAYYSINQYFDLIIGVNNYIADGKIENGKKLMRTIGLDRNQIILIGDTDHDYEVAENLKIDCLLISHGHQSEQRLKKSSNRVIKKFNQLFS